MSDWLKIGIVVILFVASMYASNILVNIISPLLIVVAAGLMTFAIIRIAMLSGALLYLRSGYVILGVILLFIACIVVAWLLIDFIKVIAWFLIGWYIFRVMLYLVAEDVYRDIDNFIAGE